MDDVRRRESVVAIALILIPPKDREVTTGADESLTQGAQTCTELPSEPISKFAQ